MHLPYCTHATCPSIFNLLATDNWDLLAIYPASCLHHLTPPTHHLTPPTHHLTPPTHHLTPPTHHLPPPTHHLTPPTHHLTPPTHQPGDTEPCHMPVATKWPCRPSNCAITNR